MEEKMIDERAAGLSPSDSIIEECSHHWVIQDGDGPTSAGVCRLCGKLKQFKNYMDASHWGDDKSKSDSNANLLGRLSRNRVVLEDDDDF